ncbi:tRNA (adenosine(37)-N6)-threonylcarbamoyltransferase complex dimerization subunit type 1 TsaB [Sporosarcina sp. HYO08]|uniref:tRNA (adenosine(37)-N6)-threonylcarbamoyltransferase complex dimerization subunit type 1 TsaB n=1 Tax=Sporosarcina sp. HYO08 TaxID=1759557 RepID=UPI00079A81BB|nr:tRNA (adenosine(37)-N6)-threonylcarbamoyltransferase complex dimerization subunit type 1 TsaB [Sporosarcina sp. HYO08]KXH78531.1 tRNA threonylcarbamoyladenosine biosynthesis protein TsaB [Sporosarcina sp. HYO08]
MIWLGIDTSNTPLSVAIVQDGNILVEYNSGLAINHSLRAMPTIEEVCKKAGLLPADIDAIAVSEGPGSYTGVRIGVTIAKTLAWTLGKPLIGVSSLQVLAANAMYFTGLICPIVDARRNNVYAGVYRYDAGKWISMIKDGHYSIEALTQMLKEHESPVLFIGKDVALHGEVLKEKLENQALFASTQYNLPRASALIDLAQRTNKEEEVHTFVPQYRRIAEAEANWLKRQGKESASE